MNTTAPEAPKCGWPPSSAPDDKLLPETISLLEQMRALSEGQKNLLVALALPRYYQVDMENDADYTSIESRGELVSHLADLHNLFLDMIGCGG